MAQIPSTGDRYLVDRSLALGLEIDIDSSHSYPLGGNHLRPFRAARNHATLHPEHQLTASTLHPVRQSSSLTLPALFVPAGHRREYQQLESSVASKIDTIPPPCHPFNRWFGSGQDCNIPSQSHLCFHRPGMDSGSCSIFVVSFSISDFLDFR